MLDQVLDLFDISPNYDLNLMQPGQDLFDVTSNVLTGIKNIIFKEEPDLVVVHGDTTTAVSASIAAFYSQIPIAHVEAGLRTNNMSAPFPEEFNRQVISKIASYHFAPTELAKNNLLSEKVQSASIFITGNTVIDSLLSVIDKAKSISYSNIFLNQLNTSKDYIRLPRIILVTGHRRENFGQGFEKICEALKEIAKQNKDIQIVYPVHLNPNVTEPVKRILSEINNIHLIEPLDYLNFVKLMNDCFLILTDSGGIQEEAPSLGKPVIVMRESTERIEGLDSGTIRLVGSDKSKIIEIVNELLNNQSFYNKMAEIKNPYGDGLASKRIYKVLSEILE